VIFLFARSAGSVLAPCNRCVLNQRITSNIEGVDALKNPS